MKENGVTYFLMYFFFIGKPHFCRKVKIYLGRNPAVGSITIYFGRPSKLRQIFFIEVRTYSFFWGLILRDIANSITPQNTLRLLPTPVGLLVLPCTSHCRRFSPYPPLSLFPCPGQRNRRRPVPVPVTGVRYNSLLRMCTLNTLT